VNAMSPMNLMGSMTGMMQVQAWQLAVTPVDMRCGMDNLLARVVAVFGQADPHVAYAFANARATRMKVLLHDGFGLWLCTRRLHQGGLVWPRGDVPQVSLNAQQWAALTVGLPWHRLQSDGQAEPIRVV
jgi:transposase